MRILPCTSCAPFPRRGPSTRAACASSVDCSWCSVSSPSCWPRRESTVCWLIRSRRAPARSRSAARSARRTAASSARSRAARAGSSVSGSSSASSWRRRWPCFSARRPEGPTSTIRGVYATVLITLAPRDRDGHRGASAPRTRAAAGRGAALHVAAWRRLAEPSVAHCCPGSYTARQSGPFRPRLCLTIHTCRLACSSPMISRTS